MKIYVMPNPKKDIGLIYTERAIKELLSVKGNEVIISSMHVLSPELEGRCLRGEPEDSEYDVMLALGGDGSVIRASHHASKKGVPLLGINLGRMGYLCDIEPDEISVLKTLCDPQGWMLEERMMLKIEQLRLGEPISAPKHVLNDVALTHGAVSKLIRLELFCNGTHAGKYGGDGLVVATPTGSTAYSLSAGGPIIDPNLSSICVTPICPHSLFSRSLIFGEGSVIEVANRCDMSGDLNVTLDGAGTFIPEVGDVIRITKSEMKTKLLRQKNKANGFCEVLYKKMAEK